MTAEKVSLREQSIVLIGFMGVGKTTIGRAVAKRLYRDFVDIDEEIQGIFGMPPSDIFKTYGEEVFRQKEKEICLKLFSKKLKVISLGGGSFLQEEIKKSCLSECIVFFLDLSWDSWKERISMLIDSRPVLQNKNMDEIYELFNERQPLYTDHHSHVKMDNKVMEEVADFITDSLKTAWDIYEPNGS